LPGVTQLLRLVLTIVVAGTAVLAPSGSAAGRATYEDDRGEGVGAPDIQGVTVSNDDAGRITFRTEIPTHQSLTQDMRLRLWFSDGHPATGLSDSGADGFILVDGFLFAPGTAVLYRCQDAICVPTAFSQEGTDDLRFAYTAGAAVLTATVGGLGVRLEVSPRLHFWFVAQAGWAYDPATQAFDPTNVRADIAPSAAGSQWTYTVDVGPSALVARSISTTPSVPRAGRQLTVRLHVVGEDTGRTITSGVVACSARIGGSRVRAVSHGFARQRATCVYLLPARAAGMVLRGSVSVALAGKRITRSFARVIR
jgi:hypothetical protein